MPVELTSRTVEIAGVELDYLEAVPFCCFCIPGGARMWGQNSSPRRI
jgi:hypothetical protein